MSHNSMPNNQQQQHSMVGAQTGGQPLQQRTMIAQRGPTVAQTGYPVANSMSQYSPIQTQAQQQASPLMSGYHNKQKQMSPDLAQFTNNVPTQNGTYTSAPAPSSLHSGLGFESGQLNLHQYQQQQQNLQASLTQYPTSAQQQQQTPNQATSPLAYRQAYSTSQQSHHHLIQQKQQLQMQQQQQVQIQQQQQPQLQQQTYQQQIQLQQQLQQRSLNHQQRYHPKQQSQPKQILQNTGEKPVSLAVSQASSAVVNHLTSNGTSPLHIDTIAKQDTTNNKINKDNKIQDIESSEKKKAESDTSSNASEKLSVANTKEKTPMCLINELARFNKMTHQYTLVDEQGPAHKKTFYVKLKLGDEEYSSSGESIKKAQHAAAAIALVETKYQHPPPKPARVTGNSLAKTDGSSSLSPDGNITPTVELNALAMKRGEATSYKSIEPQQPPYYHQPNMDYRSMCNPRYHQYMRGGRDPRYRGNGGMMWPMRCHYPRMNRAFYVSLRVGHREFIGDGPTRQTARHNAAQKALRILKNLPMPNEESKPQEEPPVKQETDDDSLKSEISLVHEIALRRNMSVQFEVIRETGPPHMKNFVSRCTVAHLVTEGEGNSKKLSKKRAAELMLEELRKLSPCPTPATARPKAKNQINKKKNRNIIKSELQQQKADPNYGVGINPISRLIQIMQAQKKKEPVYTLVAERGLPRRREFIVQVEVEDKTCSGTGPNKKLAKRAAAEAMLQALGYTKPSPQPTKSSFKNSSAESGQTNGDRKMVTFVDGDTHSNDSSSAPPQQRIPGLLHLPSKTSAAISAGRESSPKEAVINLDNILKPSLRPEIQLRELCKAMGYQVEIDDFTKKHHNGTEHITRITVGSENPQSFHGSNTSLESSRDMAALDALKVLLAKVKNVHSAGDGPQMKKDLLIRSSTSSTGKKELSK